jgi:LuxR family transcriptional activator of bioluminescence operon
MKNYPEMSYILTTTDSNEVVSSLIREVCDEFALDNFLYGGLISTSSTTLKKVVLDGYPAGWYAHYEANNYIASDPVLHHCFRSIMPIMWDSIPPSQLNDGARLFMEERRDFGLKAGATVPVHGAFCEKGLVSFTTADDSPRARAKITRALPVFQSLLPYIHDAVSRIERNGFVPTEGELSDREKECLLWAAEGKTSWETGNILSLSERTVIFHLQNAAKKLKCGNRVQAVARATSLRIINPLL